MKNKKKVYIDTYESIYPIVLVVANEYATAKDLNKYFRWGDGEDILDTEIGNCKGCVVKVVRRSDNAKVLLVKLNYAEGKDKKLDAMLTAVHEAGHVILTTYNHIEDKICSDDTKQEPFCYYLEWITKCIYITMSKK